MDPPETVEKSHTAYQQQYPPLAGAMLQAYPPPPPRGPAPPYGASYPPPIMQQPIGPPEGFYMENAPPGPINTGMPADPSIFLQYLSTVSMLQIRQKVELLELITGFETENKYVIYNEDNQPVLYATEESDCCSRQCCGPQRPFNMTIVDCYGAQVIRIERPLACQSCCFPCCLQTMTIEAPPQSYAGEVEQLWSLFGPRFAVKDAVGKTVLYIEGPFCVISCCSDICFKVLSAQNNSVVGEIRKKWSGFAQEAFTDADNFSVSFPADLEVSVKALLVGAVFLVDMMYFESSPSNNR